MAVETIELARWIQLVAVVSGVLVISLPLLRLWLRRGTKRAGSIGNRISFTRWPLVFVLTILYLAIGILLWKPILLYMSPSIQLTSAVAGSMIYFPGIILYLWSFKTLGLMYGVSTISGAQLYEKHHIIDSGPYSFTRHPMYLGVMLAAIGALLIFRTWAMVIFTPSAFVVILRARQEEQLLAREFGPSWADYCKRVPAWMPRSLRGNRNTDEQVDH